MSDPLTIAEALRRRQDLTLSTSFDRTKGLTASSTAASRTPGLPANLNMFDPTSTFGAIDRTMRMEAMKTASGRFKDWITQKGDVNAAMVVDNLPSVVDYSRALEDAVQYNVGNLLTVQGKNILGIGKRTASGAVAIAKTLVMDPTGMSQKLTAYTDIMMGREPSLPKDAWGNSYADDVEIFRSMPAEEQQRIVDDLANVVLQRTEVQDEIRETFQRYQREQFYTNFGRATDFRDIDSLWNFMEYSANAGSNVAATAGAVLVASYLGAAAAPAVGVSAVTGGTAAAVTLSAILESADIAGELAAAGDLNRYTAARALAFGTLSGAVEGFVGAPKFLSAGFGRKLSKEILEVGGKRVARRLGRQALVSMGEEMVQEGIQTYLQQLGVGGMDAVVPDYEDVMEILNGAIQGALGGGMLAGISSIRQATIIRSEAKSAIGGMGYRERMTALFEAKKELTPQNASPKLMQELTDALGMEGKSILFQAEDISSWAAENSIDIPTLLEELGIRQADFEAAMTSDGYVSVTAGSVIAYGLVEGRSDFFINNGKFQAKDFSASEVNTIKERISEINEQIEAGELGPQRTEVYDHIKGQRMQTGVSEGQAHSEAVMWTAVFDTLGTYTGSKAADILERFGIKVARGTAETAPAGLQQEGGVVKFDNPGGDWLADKQRYAGEAMSRADAGSASAKGIVGSTTAYTRAVSLPVDMLSTIPGAMDESPAAGKRKFDDLTASVEAEGFRTDSPILVGINHRGEPYIVEGNNRVAVAAAQGIDRIPAEVRWYNGGEEVAGALTPDMVNEMSSDGQTLFQKYTPEEALDNRGPLRSARGTTYQGVVDEFTVENPSLDAPSQPLILNKTSAGNAQIQTEALDLLHSRHPSPLESEAAWVAMMNDAFGTERVMMPPWRSLDIVQKGADAVVDELGNMPSDMQQSALEGLATAQAIGKAYTDGTAAPADTAYLFLWSFLSRGVTPYVQEGAFLDAAITAEFAAIVESATSSGWSEALASRYDAWAQGLLKPGTPGRGTTHNLNAFGSSFMRVMTTRNADELTGLETIHNMIVEGRSSRDIRREFLRVGDNAGIDNKVVSFTLLLTGRDDVLVLDRIQMRNQMDDGRFGYNIYDDQMVGGKAQNGTGVARLSFGHKGLLYYEALEDALAPIVAEAYTQMGRGVGSLGRYHWDSWVAASNQEVGHASLDGFARKLSGDPDGMSGSFVRQGKFGSYDYGFKYTVLANGNTGTVVDLPNNSSFLIPAEEVGAGKPLHKGFSKILTQLKKQHPDLYKAPSTLSKPEWTVPWTSLMTEEQVNAYQKTVASVGELIDVTVFDATDASGRADGDPAAGVRRLYQSATAQDTGQRQADTAEGRPADDGQPSDAVSGADLRNLTEEGVEDFFKRPGWAVISGTQDWGDNPFGPQHNARAAERLRADLTNMGAEFVEQKGYYEGEDDGTTFLAVIDAQTAEKLGKQYGQDSILTNEGLVYTNRVQPPTPLTGEVTTGAAATKEDFYSAIEGGPSYSLDLNFNVGAGHAVFSPGYTEAVNRPQLPVNDVTGLVELHHWGPAGLTEIDPAFAGTGPMRGAERKAGQKISFYGINPRENQTDAGTGYVKEHSLPENHYIAEIEAADLYPFRSDPDGITAGKTTAEGEQAVKDAGYAGYYVEDRGGTETPLGNVAVLFKKLPVTEQAAEDQAAPRTLFQKAGFSQTDITQTPAFKKWFGDSKVVDENGDPMIVYHGTAADIKSFDPSKLGDATGAASAKMGFFFASDPAVASSYAEAFNVYRDTTLGKFLNKITFGKYAGFNEALLKLVGAPSAIEEGANVVPVYLSIQNPMIVDFQGSEYRDQTYVSIVAEAKAQGHDGVILRNTFDAGFGEGGDVATDVYVAFEPTQIKSQFNKGTFDPADPRILEQTAEEFVADSSVKEPQFHATNAEFDVFSNPEIGFHFASDPDLASNAALKGGKEGASVQSFYLNIKNPVVLDEGVTNGWPVFRTLDLLLDKGVITDNEYADAMDLYDDAEDTLAIDMTEQEFKAASAHIVTDLLKSKGFDGIKYWNTFDAGPATQEDFDAAMRGETAGPEAGWSYIAFSPEQIKSVDAQRFDASDPRFMGQKKETGVQGQIEFPAQGMGQGEDTLIRLFNIENKSTFLHESGHFFFEMYRVLASEEGAPQQVVDMWSAVNRHLGREEGDTSALTTDHHEILARSFEAYLMSGKAPTVGLRSAFRNFAHWLVGIYKNVSSLNVTMNDEIVDVMERMLATQEEIQLAKDEVDLGPLFPGRPAGMSNEGWEAYRDAVNREDVEAESELLARAMGKIRRETTAAHRDEVETRADDIRDGLRRSKGFQSIERLTSEPRKEMRLNKAQLIERFGAEAVAELDAQLQANELGGKYKAYSPSGGDIDVVASALGYRDATHLMEDMTSTGRSWESAEARATAQLDQIHGDALADGTLREAAISSLQNNPKTSRMMMEAAELRRTIEDEYGNPPPTMSMKALRAHAHRRHQALSVKNGNNPEAFLRAERKAMRKVRDATERLYRRTQGSRLQTPAREDLLRAHAAMRTAMLNQLMYIEAKKSLAIETRIKRMEKQLRSKRKASRKVDEDFLTPLTALMEQFGFRKMAQGQLPQVADLKALENSEAGQRRADELSFSPVVASVREYTDYSTISVSLLIDLHKTMENLNKLGRSEMQAFYEGKKMSFEAVMAEALNTIASFEEVERGLSETDKEKRSKNLAVFYNSLKTADSILSKLDNFEFGTFQRTLKLPINDAMNRYMIRNQQSKNDLAKIFTEHYSDRTSMTEQIAVPELGGTFSREEILSMALNTGNAINWRRLISDKRWTDQYGLDNVEQRMKSALENALTENDWRYVTDMWQYIGSLWPEISAQEKKLTGVTPLGVEAEPFVTPYAFIKGGYYPIRYDRRFSASVTTNQLEDTLKNMRSGRSARAQTKNGHVQERLDSTGGMAVDYSLTIAAGHINEVLFDLELRQPIASAWRVLNDRRLKELMSSKGLAAENEALQWWIQDVANNDTGMRDGWNAVFGYMRAGMTISKMGFSWSTLIQQPLGLLQTGVNVGKVRTLTQLAKYLSSPRSHEAAVKQASLAMQERQITYERDVMIFSDALNNDPVVGKMRKWQSAVTKAAFFAIQKSQYWCVDVPTWMAGYDKAISDGESHESAILIADALLARSQGSGVLSDRTAAERGTVSADSRNNHYLRLSTAFGSYMISAKFNSALQRIGYFNTHRSAGELLNLFVDLIIMFSLETAASMYLTGRWPDDDDMEDEGGFAAFMAKQTAYTAIAGVPILREAGSAFEGFGAGGPAGGYMETSVDFLKGGSTAAQILLGLEEKDKLRRATKDVIGGFGVLLQTPTIQLERILTALVEEDLRLRDDFNGWDLLTGRRD